MLIANAHLAGDIRSAVTYSNAQRSFNTNKKEIGMVKSYCKIDSVQRDIKHMLYLGIVLPQPFITSLSPSSALPPLLA